jgi:MalT-like TPR region
VSHLAIAWTAPIVGDFDGALRWALLSVEHLRAQDEPFWTAVAVATAGSLETVVGRYDDASRHLGEARDLAGRFDSAWLNAWTRVQLGVLAVARGQYDEAWAPIDKGLSLSLAAHSTPLITLCLAAFARLARADGDPERAALLAGAVTGLRERAGVRAWPMLRQQEADLVAQVREALGTDCFDALFAEGSRLNQQAAVAAARDQHRNDARATSTAA